MAEVTAADVERIVVTALKPIFRRIVALERDSHPPVDFAEEIEAARPFFAMVPSYETTLVQAFASHRQQAVEEAARRILALEKALLMCAPSHQGGHSETGAEIAAAFDVPFPLSMDTLRPLAIGHGYLPYDLWPWLERMENGRTLSTKDR